LIWWDRLLERIRRGVPAQITLDELGGGLEAEFASAGARLPGTRAGDSAYRLTSRRRRGDAHRVFASVLAVLAIVGCVTAVLLLAIAPTASRMQSDITALSSRLDTADSQLSALQKTAVHTAREGSRLTRSVNILNRHMHGLGRTIHGLQGTTNATREETDGLRACFATLQAELSGLTLRTRSVHGHVTNVGLAESAGVPAACGAVFTQG
jgi:outer membrane murein-binding lipoprotein Lpp